MNKLGRMMMLNNSGRRMSIEYEDDRRDTRRDDGYRVPMEDDHHRYVDDPNRARDMWPDYDDDKVIGFDRSKTTVKTSDTMGHASSDRTRGHTLTEREAKEWTAKMRNADGTVGPHWDLDQVKTVMQQRGVDVDLPDFYAVLNMIYSDYSEVAKHLGISNIDFYVGMAKAFLDDKDADPGKAARYYAGVVM